MITSLPEIIANAFSSENALERSFQKNKKQLILSRSTVLLAVQE
jgi:hypothetical protein